jgi:hypothetical protein
MTLPETVRFCCAKEIPEKCSKTKNTCKNLFIMFGYSWFSTTEQSLITRLHYSDEDHDHLALKMYASVTDNVIETASGNFIPL